MLTLADPLEHARRIHAERLAAIDGDRRLRYSELARRSHQLGSGLRQLGVKPGERVALLSANSHRYIEAFFGIPSHGMILVPLNTRLAQPELLAILRDCQPRVLLTDRDPGPLAAAVGRRPTRRAGYGGGRACGGPRRALGRPPGFRPCPAGNARSAHTRHLEPAATVK